MEGIGELFGFISGIGEEISNIFTGEGMVTQGYAPVTPPARVHTRPLARPQAPKRRAAPRAWGWLGAVCLLRAARAPATDPPFARPLARPHRKRRPSARWSSRARRGSGRAP